MEILFLQELTTLPGRDYFAPLPMPTEDSVSAAFSNTRRHLRAPIARISQCIGVERIHIIRYTLRLTLGSLYTLNDISFSEFMGPALDIVNSAASQEGGSTEVGMECVDLVIDEKTADLHEAIRRESLPSKYHRKDNRR